MKDYISYLFQVIKRWCYLKFTRAGRKEAYFNKALGALQEDANEKDKIAKVAALKTSAKLLNVKKIIGFHKKGSIAKSKTTKHKLHKAVTTKHKDVLETANLKIDKKTLAFKDA